MNKIVSTYFVKLFSIIIIFSHHVIAIILISGLFSQYVFFNSHHVNFVVMRTNLFYRKR